MAQEVYRPLDELREKLRSSKASVWDLPGLARDDVVAWADNAPVDWPAERRAEMCDDGRHRQHDAEYARFAKLDIAESVEELLAWYVPRFVPAAAITEAIAWGVSVLPPGPALTRVNIGMVETLTIGRVENGGVGAFINVRASVLDAAYENGELTLREVFGDRIDDMSGDEGEGDEELPEDASSGDDGPEYRTVGEDHFRMWFDDLAEIRRVLTIPVMARAARLLNASLIRTTASNAKKGHTPAAVDRAFPGGKLQPVT